VATFLHCHCILENVVADSARAAVGRRCGEDLNWMTHESSVVEMKDGGKESGMGLDGTGGRRYYGSSVV
jgi:hypothetical protein